MRYTDRQIYDTLHDFMQETGQRELRYIIPFCLGYYGYITKQIWRIISTMLEYNIIDNE